MDELLAKFKLSIGDLTPGNALNEYYSNFLCMAKWQLLSNDISEEALSSQMGQSAVILYAEALMNKRDIANDATLTLLRNMLSTETKGARYADGK